MVLYLSFQTNKFTDEDIRGVVKSFKMNFPQGFHITVYEIYPAEKIWKYNFVKET